MTVVNNVFPQSGDADFAENFATWLGRGNISSYVETGLNLTVDYASSPPTVDISEGKSYVILDQSEISSNNETRLNLDYAITTGEVIGLSINASEENNLLYLNPNVGVNDSPSFEVETDSGNAGENWLFIGVIDTVNDTSEERNRNPDADFGSLTSRNSFSLPVYSELSSADSSEASIVFIDGNGSDKQGVYVDDGTGFITVGVRQISELTDVTGVDSVIADSGNNRPSSGTAGRVFIDTNNNKIQFDTGSTWVDIGTNPSSIGAGDLGFNTATQSELDAHISVTDPHHTPPGAGDGLKSQSNNFNIEPADFSGSFLSDDGSDNLQVNLGSGIVGDGSDNITLQNDSITINANDGLKSGGTIALGGSVGLDIEPADFAGSGLSDDGTDNLTLTNDSITISAGSNLTGGGTVSLGGSITLNAESSTDTTTDVSENNSTVVNQTSDINFTDSGASSVNVSDDGDGTVSVNIDSTDTNTNTTYSAGNALNLSGTQFNVNESGIDHDNISGVSSGDHHFRYGDDEARSAINNDNDHGSTASHNYYSDSEAVSAIENYDSVFNLSTDIYTGGNDIQLTDGGSILLWNPADGTFWSLGVNTDEDLRIAVQGNGVAEFKGGGDLDLAGSLTENTSL